MICQCGGRFTPAPATYRLHVKTPKHRSYAEGFRCIGIEREQEYLDIAVARLAHQPVGMAL